MRRARIWQRGTVLSQLDTEETALAKRIKQLCDFIQPEHLKNTTVFMQTSQYAIHKAHQAASEKMKTFLLTLAEEEVKESAQQGIDAFFEGAWAKEVTAETLTKEQYIISHYNLHEYVRYTTRLAARCIAHADDMTLRNHFIYHLRGEVNHEIMIERDLAHLGADVDFLLHHHIPTPATKVFMVVQESTIGFYQDTGLMLACPMAAEGVASAMEKREDFLPHLFNCAKKWGADPKKAVWFWSSHINTDGGEDGHWQAVIKTTMSFINSEDRLKRFLSILRAAQNGFNDGYNANITDFPIWSLPEHH